MIFQTSTGTDSRTTSRAKVDRTQPVDFMQYLSFFRKEEVTPVSFWEFQNFNRRKRFTNLYPLNYNFIFIFYYILIFYINFYTLSMISNLETNKLIPNFQIIIQTSDVTNSLHSTVRLYLAICFCVALRRLNAVPAIDPQKFSWKIPWPTCLHAFPTFASYEFSWKTLINQIMHL